MTETISIFTFTHQFPTLDHLGLAAVSRSIFSQSNIRLVSASSVADYIRFQSSSVRMIDGILGAMLASLRESTFKDELLTEAVRVFSSSHGGTSTYKTGREGSFGKPQMHYDCRFPALGAETRIIPGLSCSPRGTDTCSLYWSSPSKPPRRIDTPYTLGRHTGIPSESAILASPD
ncbi:hypothetical protein FA13DRAFT_1476301 [Coprinellus micaceus]|uniref:Uncharacterized protein n=1 Tax=Coprinellus micaceus TaxID=71717 RepID=A0A4Y7SL62_COPMI|nr:hypothetical protein FA13DRAFT_1476301 [Coprinellus micaceus]